MGEHFDIVKLNGFDNYHLWKFAVQNVIDFQSVSDALIIQNNAAPNVAVMTDEAKLAKAKALISLSVEIHIYAHIQPVTSALEIWNTLKNLYEDRGLSRRITLLRELISIRLEDSKNMNHYVGRIKSTLDKLNGIGFNLDSEWLGAIILAGLTDDFRPLMIGKETNNEQITADLVTPKLLDTQSSNETNAFFNKSQKIKKNKKNKRGKCYTCGSKSHLSDACDQKDSKNITNDTGKCNKKPDSKKTAAFVTLICKSKKQVDDSWYLDSGAACHMTPNDENMRNVKHSSIKEIIGANNGTMRVEKRGSMSIELNEIYIDMDVLHVPDISVNLLSVYQICKEDNTIIFNKNGCQILNADGEVLIQCKATDGVYKLSKAIEIDISTDKSENTSENSAFTWHRRLGHMNLDTMKRMKSCGLGVNFANAGERMIKECEICALGKKCRKPFKPSEIRSKDFLELIHSDVMGPMETRSIGHKLYVLIFIDDFSRKLFVRFLSNKDKVLNEFKAFKTFIEKRTGKSIKVLRSDNGGAPYTPQQNGLAERMNRMLKEKAKCLLFDAKLPKYLWAEATHMAAYIINRSICAALEDKTPNEVFYGKKSNISDLKIFGSKVMVHIPKCKRRKCDANTEKMIFVGYDDDTNGFRCINKNTRKLTISHDVTFHEDIENNELHIECNSDEGNDNDEEDSVTVVDELGEEFASARNTNVKIIE